MNEYRRYLVSLRNALIQCGKDFGDVDPDEEDLSYSELCTLSEELEDILWYYSMLAVSGSKFAMRGYVVPLGKYFLQEYRRFCYQEYEEGLLEYKKLMAPKASLSSEKSCSSVENSVKFNVESKVEVSPVEATDEGVEFVDHGIYLEDSLDEGTSWDITDEDNPKAEATEGHSDSSDDFESSESAYFSSEGENSPKGTDGDEEDDSDDLDWLEELLSRESSGTNTLDSASSESPEVTKAFKGNTSKVNEHEGDISEKSHIEDNQAVSWDEYFSKLSGSGYLEHGAVMEEIPEYDSIEGSDSSGEGIWDDPSEWDDESISSKSDGWEDPSTWDDEEVEGSDGVESEWEDPSSWDDKDTPSDGKGTLEWDDPSTWDDEEAEGEQDVSSDDGWEDPSEWDSEEVEEPVANPESDWDDPSEWGDEESNPSGGTTEWDDPSEWDDEPEAEVSSPAWEDPSEWDDEPETESSGLESDWDDPSEWDSVEPEKPAAAVKARGMGTEASVGKGSASVSSTIKPTKKVPRDSADILTEVTNKALTSAKRFLYGELKHFKK